ncbi:MAG: tetratricopeptide repeat protein [Propionibacteriaceae bacterium]|nr:tetratricopeptide repeat protein [Propionibacteriaceae bacterium]
MSYSLEEANSAIAAITGLPVGVGRIRVAERLVRRIEVEGPDEARAYALHVLVGSWYLMGKIEQALVVFHKLRKWWIRHPEHVDSYDQHIGLWFYVWLIDGLGENSSVHPQHIDTLLESMEKHYGILGQGMDRVWKTRLEWSMLRGAPEVDANFVSWFPLPVDPTDSCQPCATATHAKYLIYCGDIEGAATVLEAALSQDMSCGQEPQTMLSLLMWCYIELEKLEQAEKTLAEALMKVTSMGVTRHNEYARLFEVLARGHLVDRALGLMEKISVRLEHATQYIRLNCLRSVLSGITCLIAQGHGDRQVAFEGVSLSLRELLTCVDTEAQELSALFDARDSTGIHAARLDRARQVKSTSRPLNFMLFEPLPTPQPVAPPTLEQVSLPQPISHPSPLTRVPSRHDSPNNSRTPQEPPAQETDADESLDRYYRNSEEALAQGNLLTAGWCLAEAAHLHQVDRNVSQANDDYATAVVYLKAGGVRFEDITPLLAAWAPDVDEARCGTFLSQGYNGSYYFKGTNNSSAGEEPFNTVISQREAGDDNYPIVSSPMIKKYLHAKCVILDAMARVMATWGSEQEKREAIRMVDYSAVWMDSLGCHDFAAHAWWLEANLCAELQNDRADEYYRLALRCFQFTAGRGLFAGRQVAIEYASYLTTQDRHEEAQAITAVWVTPPTDRGGHSQQTPFNSARPNTADSSLRVNSAPHNSNFT